MQLFYSGAYQIDKPQTDPSKSVGGFPSSSPIPNGLIDSIFPSITSVSLTSGLNDTRLIVLKNTTGSGVTGISLWTVKGNYSTYNIAAVAPAIDNCSRSVFELLYSGNATPFQAILAPQEGSGNALVVGDLEAGGYIGIWIQRVIDPTKFTALDGLPGATPACDVIISTLQADNGTPKYDAANLVINW